MPAVDPTVVSDDILAAWEDDEFFDVPESVPEEVRSFALESRQHFCDVLGQGIADGVNAAVGGGAVPTTRTLTAGNGLTGGGDLSADRTFNVGAGTGIVVAADTVAADFGTGAGKVVQGNDAALTNDRTASGLRTASTVVDVHTATAPTAGQVLTATGGSAATWQTPASGGVPTSRTVQGTAPIRVDGDNATHDLSADRVWSFGFASEAQGDLAYRGASGWARLAAGTAGDLLKTGGTGADPSWTSPASVTGLQRAELADDAISVAQSSAPQVIGRFYYDPAEWSLTGKTLTFQSTFSSVDGSATATVKIYNLSSATYVAAANGQWSTTSATQSRHAGTGFTGAVTGFDPTVACVLEVHVYTSASSGIVDHSRTELVAQ